MEHLLSALEACGVDNARIEIEGGPEVPIIDGSALSWAIDLHAVRVFLLHHHTRAVTPKAASCAATGCEFVDDIIAFCYATQK